MTKFKKLMALAAVSMLGIQLMGVGTAFAAGPEADSDCDFGSDSLDITLGQNELNGGSDKADVTLWIDADGMLQCDTFGSSNDGEQAVSTIDSITVEMDDDDSDAKLTIYLDPDGDGSGGDDDATEWPSFDTFDIDVTTTLYVDGGGVNTGAGVSASNNLSIKFGKDTFSFAGTSGTYAAYALDIEGGKGKDSIDASKASVKVTAHGGDGADLIKGGSGNDKLYGDAGDDVLYGYAGNDTLNGGASTVADACWAGADNDSTIACEVVAPGAGDDDVDNAATTITYGDVTGGIEWTNLTSLGGTAADIATGGEAGSDTFALEPTKVYGSAGDDVIADDNAFVVKGGAGDDFLKVKVGADATHYALGEAGDDLIVAFDATGSQALFGGPGNDVLKGKDGQDELRGGAGKDQAWGGSGNADFCVAEVTNRCEEGKV